MESLLMAEVRLCFFLFKQKTAYEMRISDWSADVCSSDLETVRSVSVRSLAFRRQRLSPRLSGRPLAPPLQSSSPNCSPACASAQRSEEHTSELQSLMRISYAVFCLKKKKQKITHRSTHASNDK